MTSLAAKELFGFCHARSFLFAATREAQIAFPHWGRSRRVGIVQSALLHYANRSIEPAARSGVSAFCRSREVHS